MEYSKDKTPEADDLEALVEGGDEGAIRRFLTLLHPADLAILFDTLDRDYWPRVVQFLDTAEISDLMEELHDHLRDDLAELLKPDQLVDVFEEMASDDAADVIADLPDDMAKAVLEGIPDEDRQDVEALLRYEEDTAGGLMQVELVAVPETATVERAVEIARSVSEDVEEFHQVYVIDEGGKLTGTLGLDRLILAKPETLVGDLADRDLYVVHPDDDQEEVARIVKRYDLVSVAVVNAEGALLGRILHDDIVDVLEEEAAEDMLRMAGAEEPELVYTNRVFKIASVRLPWLLATVGGGLVSGVLLWQFKVTFPTLLTLLTFVPVIAAMGGNIGSQSSTIVIRGFATGHIDYNNLARYLTRELAIGSMMGVVLGAVLGATAQLWHGDPKLAFVVGLSMTLAITASALTGVLVPFFFRLIKVDPAIAAGPLVTTANDVMCLAIYYGMALMIL